MTTDEIKREIEKLFVTCNSTCAKVKIEPAGDGLISLVRYGFEKKDIKEKIIEGNFSELDKFGRFEEDYKRESGISTAGVRAIWLSRK